MTIEDRTQQAAARPRRITTASHVSSPVDGVTEPDFVISDVTPDGRPTQGIQLLLKAPTTPGVTAAVPVTDGYNLTVWIRNPITKQWGDTWPFSIQNDQWWVNGDFNGGEIYLQFEGDSIDTQGSVDFEIVEV